MHKTTRPIWTNQHLLVNNSKWTFHTAAAGASRPACNWSEQKKPHVPLRVHWATHVRTQSCRMTAVEFLAWSGAAGHCHSRQPYANVSQLRRRWCVRVCVCEHMLEMSGAETGVCRRTADACPNLGHCLSHLTHTHTHMLVCDTSLRPISPLYRLSSEP